MMLKAFLKGFVKEDASHWLHSVIKFFSKDLNRKRFKLATASNPSLLKVFFKGKCFKPAPASNQGFLDGGVKEKATRPLQPPKKSLLQGFAQEHAYLEHGVASPMFDESDWQLTHASNLRTAGFLDIKT